MHNKELLDKLKSYIHVNENGIIYEEMITQNLSFQNLRDKLIGLGKILEEDDNAKIYVIAIMAGVGNANSAVVAMKLADDKLLIAGYAKEGFINQHTANQAIDKVMKKI